MIPAKWTYGQLIMVAQNEVEQRRRVYPRLVSKGDLRQAEADYKIAAMEEIVRVLTVMRDKHIGPHAQPQKEPEP